MTFIRQASAIGVAWTTIWLVFWVLFAVATELVSPGSIDPGEPLGMLLILGSMGVLTGFLFGSLVVRDRVRAGGSVPLLRAAALGAMATAVVQMAYLGHGDQGLAANLAVAGLFVVIGGFVTILWHALMRVMRGHAIARVGERQNP